MWRTSYNLLKQGLTTGVRRNLWPRLDGSYYCGGGGASGSGYRRVITSLFYCSSTSPVAVSLGDNNDDKKNGGGGGTEGENKKISYEEAKRLIRLVNVEALKMKLGMENKEVIGYKELLEACERMGVAKSPDEATAFARVLDEAGVVLLFRDKVYLHPDKVVDLVRKAVPLALLPEDDPSKDEMNKLQEKKEQIDRLAHKQVRGILWTGLGLAIIQVGLFFRLTFWEFSWDVMEPIAFFITASGIVIGYAYFLFTSRDPTYQDFMQRLFFSRQRKLFKKYNFDIEKFRELRGKCKSPLDVPTVAKHRTALHTDPDDLLHGH